MSERVVSQKPVFYGGGKWLALLGLLLSALGLVMGAVPVAAGEENLVVILDVDPEAANGNAGDHMESIPPTLVFPEEQGGGTQIIEQIFFSSIPEAVLDISVKRYPHEQMTLVMEDWPVDELFHLLEGRVEIVNTQNGVVQTYGSGDRFIIPRGFMGIWRQLSPVHMITVEYGPLVTVADQLKKTNQTATARD
tara:strand:+ start:18004 stop:18582 length:579 start_codon:yes stop_codon:yes gene_type:complete